MSFKRIALCVMYAMIAMFAINTTTADAEDEAVVTELTTNDTINYSVSAYAEEVPQVRNEVVANGEAVQNEFVTDTQTEVVTGGTENAEITSEEAVNTPAPDKTDKKDKKDSNDKNIKKDSKKIDTKKTDKKNSNNYTKAELRLLSTLIYCEAGNEPYAGKLAVGIVVMNRKESRGFANTVRGVIYQKCQFSPVRNGSLNRALARYDSGKFNSAAEKQCIKAAKEALSGEKFVTYGGKTKNFKSFMFFNGYVSGARYRIKGHMFK